MSGKRSAQWIAALLLVAAVAFAFCAGTANADTGQNAALTNSGLPSELTVVYDKNGNPVLVPAGMKVVYDKSGGWELVPCDPDDGCFVDTDGDGVQDASDNCKVNYNPDQSDRDRDGTGDVCDSTPDGDPAPPPPTVPSAPFATLTASPATLTAGQSTVVSWDSNAGSCTGSWVGSSLPFRGSSEKLYPSTTTDYGVTCGGVTATTRVTVNQPSAQYQCNDLKDNDGDGRVDLNDLGCSSPTDNNEGDEISPPPTATPFASLRAVNTTIPFGATAALEWKSNAASCYNATWTSDSLPASGTVWQLQLSATTTYSITCGDITATATVTVLQPEADSDGDTILDSRDNCKTVPNKNQADADGNGIGDACDDAWALNGLGIDVSSSPILLSGSSVYYQGGVVVKYCGYARGEAVFKQRLTGKTFWRFYASVRICWQPLTGKILSIGSTSAYAGSLLKPFWSYNNNPNWSPGPLGGSTSWAEVTASFTGCPFFSLIQIGCNTVNVRIRFTIFGGTDPHNGSYNTAISFF